MEPIHSSQLVEEHKLVEGQHTKILQGADKQVEHHSLGYGDSLKYQQEGELQLNGYWGSEQVDFTH